MVLEDHQAGFGVRHHRALQAGTPARPRPSCCSGVQFAQPAHLLHGEGPEQPGGEGASGRSKVASGEAEQVRSRQSPGWGIHVATEVVPSCRHKRQKMGCGGGRRGIPTACAEDPPGLENQNSGKQTLQSRKGADAAAGQMIQSPLQVGTSCSRPRKASATRSQSRLLRLGCSSLGKPSFPGRRGLSQVTRANSGHSVPHPSRLAWPRLPVLREQGIQHPSPRTGNTATKFTVNKQRGDVPGKSLAHCQRATAGAEALECPEGLGTKPREGQGPAQVPRKGGEGLQGDEEAKAA